MHPSLICRDMPENSANSHFSKKKFNILVGFSVLLTRLCIPYQTMQTAFYVLVLSIFLSCFVTDNSLYFSSVMQTFFFSSSAYCCYNWQVSLSGHLFDQFLINEALDIIETAGGSFHLVKCQVGQSSAAPSYSELEVS